ncbi:flagellar hook-associated protein 3 [Pseudomonas sp. 21LCFQ02]|uniref:flagellar hook-associated protein 3 n=1 Tax=Pseudomonas sp. 21LCFQ02 TaxID=2957505 RepID=UPI00209B6901|nr:flagellar hook-associated protein 3 [Pseudomonas sp. 21LCFQ02]MCO8167324.1 flagellar hook-associated protein 3 [Pseudomonas sp. 21LCFQ02]
MRISTTQIYEASNASYQRNYAKFVKAGDEATSGVKLNSAGDDPVGAARVLQLAQQNSMLEQYAANITTINYNTANSETALASIVNALQRVSELVISGGNGGYTDADRTSTAEELKQLQEQILGLMNSQDANGSYLFSGSDAAQPPYSRNADGTYSYHGNQTSVGLPVGDGLVLPSNTTGWEAFDKATNTTRTSVMPTGGTPNDDKLNLSGGIVSSTSAYNSSFVPGQPYTLTFVSATEFRITDGAGNNVTGDASTAGVYNATDAAAQKVTFRGVDLTLNVNLSRADAATAATAEAALGLDPGGSGATRTYEFSSTLPTLSPTRSAGNTSAAVVTQASVTDRALFNTTYPATGAMLVYNAGAYELRSGNNPPLPATVSGTTVTVAGASFEISGTPNDGDQFVIDASTHQTQNVLNSISQVITALTTPADGNPVALQKLVASLDSAMGNVTSAIEQAATARSAIGARQNAATDQGVTNDYLKTNNTVESQSFTKADEMEAATNLTLQKNILAASQQVFLQLSNLNLFSKL